MVWHERLCVHFIGIYASQQSPHLLCPVVSDTVIDFQGLTIVQVSQNQAAVISDPQNQIFVIKNAGFVALALEGSYDVLAVVDQTHLQTKLKDRVTGAVLGSTHEVKMKSKIHAENTEYVVALLFVNLIFQDRCIHLSP